MIKQEPTFYSIWLNELNILGDTLKLYYPSNGGENTASAEKLAEELLRIIKNYQSSFSDDGMHLFGLYIEWQENFNKW